MQVCRAGGRPEILGVARDNYESTRAQVRQGLEADLLLLSGGVSAGKYDLVEKVLAEFGAKFFFDRVMIQPGQPLVFGKAQGKFFFGLPGNPGSTMITFETIARAALEKMQGLREPALPLLRARLDVSLPAEDRADAISARTAQSGWRDDRARRVPGLGRRRGAGAL